MTQKIWLEGLEKTPGVTVFSLPTYTYFIYDGSLYQKIGGGALSTSAIDVSNHIPASLSGDTLVMVPSHLHIRIEVEK